MKDLFVGNSDAWLRLSAAVLALFLAGQVAKQAPKEIQMPKPGIVMEW